MQQDPHASSTPTPPADNSRKLGIWMCLALVVGNIIGSGVFLLPASLAPYGFNSVIGWIVTAAGAMFLAVVFAQLARIYPQAGGPYVYPRVAFGELVGFLMAWGYWTSVWVGNAAIAIGTVASLAELVPALKTTVGAPAVTACLHDLDAHVRELSRRQIHGRVSARDDDSETAAAVGESSCCACCSFLTLIAR